MKKMLLLALSAAFALTSCNSDPKPWDYGAGAYFPLGNYMINFDGTKFTLPQIADPNYIWKLNRYYMEVSGYIPDGTPADRGPGITVPFTETYDGPWLYDSHLLTFDEETYDDPVILNLDEIDAINRDPGRSYVDFFAFRYAHFIYEGNKGKDDIYANTTVCFQDQEIIPGAQIDTISIRMRFFNNRKDDEKPFFASNGYDLVDRDFKRTALDLQSLNVSNEDKEYIIKLNIKCFADTYNIDPDETETKMVYLLSKWNPAKPYYE